MVLEKLDNDTPQNEISPQSYLTKNTLKWVKDFNIRPEAT